MTREGTVDMSRRSFMLGLTAGAVAGGVAAEGAPAATEAPKPGKVTLAGICQPRIRWDREKSYREAEALVKTAADRGAQIACLPEGALEGYIVQQKGLTPERYRSIGETVPDGEYVRRYRELARRLGIYLVPGFAERAGRKMHNACLLIGPDGEIIGHYRKTHLMHREPLNEAGTQLPVYDLPFGRVGMMICFDRQPPETARILAVKGADLILNPAMGSYGGMNDIMMRTRAYENSLHVAFVHFHDCLLIDARGNIVARYQEGGDRVVMAELDLAENRGRLLKYRKPELYDELTAGGPR
ncbi:MAG: carbon-nitrogen hydrolase family protein [Armatimonadota bacterium]|jgi:predicted amidohydrolase